MKKPANFSRIPILLSFVLVAAACGTDPTESADPTPTDLASASSGGPPGVKPGDEGPPGSKDAGGDARGDAGPDAKKPTTVAPPQRLHADGRHLVTPNGAIFPWRFVTFFGGIDLVADGKSAQAEVALAWFAAHGVNGVRVFSMMGNAADTVPSLFDLSPTEGVAALPAFLDLAAKHGLYVEIIALANTKSEWAAWYPGSVPAHLTQIGAIAAKHDNALVELANEAIHPSQADDLYQRLGGWRALIPANVPVATGLSAEDYYFDDAAFPTRAIADYITVHADRADGDNGWRTVRHVRELGDIAGKFNKPVISDEPIGADETDQPGRRIADPGKHFGLAIIPRLVDIAGTTFHYEAGLKYDVPTGNQLHCFNAWMLGGTLFPASTVLTYQNSGFAGSPVASFAFAADQAPNSALRVYSGVAGATNKAYSVVVRKAGNPGIQWSGGWLPGGSIEYYAGIEVIPVGKDGVAAPTLPKSPYPVPPTPPPPCLGGSYTSMQNGWATKNECDTKVAEAGVTKACVLTNGCWLAQ